MVTVTKSNVQLITGLSERETQQVKEDLTFRNPKYDAAIRFSRYTRIPKYITMFRDSYRGIVTPLGYNFPLDKVKVIDKREEVVVKYPHFRLTLRDTQREAYNKFVEDTDKGVIVLPTAKGKTVLGIYIACSLSQKTLVICHKEDLLNSWRADAKKCLGIECGVIRGKQREIGTHITVATIQTLNRLSDKELEKLYHSFGLVIVDEAHHVPSNGYQLLTNFHSAYKLGLTATPERKDGMIFMLHLYLGDISYNFKHVESDKDIMPVEVLVREVAAEIYPKVNNQGLLDIRGTDIRDVDPRKAPKVPYSYMNELVMANRQFRDQYTDDIIKEHNKGRSCLCLVTTKSGVQQIRSALIAKGVKANKILLYYGDSTEDSSVIIDKAESTRDMITIATVSKVSEGTNCVQWEVLFLISSMNDGKLVEQSVGRVRRKREGVDKIPTARVYDYRFNHTFMMEHHQYTRDKRYRKLHFNIIKEREVQESKRDRASRPKDRYANVFV